MTLHISQLVPCPDEHSLEVRLHARRQRLARRSRRRTSGATSRAGVYAVEFAVTASVFFMMIFAAFEFSRFVFARHAVDQAAFEAARVIIAKGRKSQEAKTMATAMLNSSGLKASLATITVSPTTITDLTQTVKVRVSCSFADNSWLPPTFFVGTMLVSEVELDHENKAYLAPQGRPSIGTNSQSTPDTL